MSLISLVSRMLDVGLNGIFNDFVSYYREIIHFTFKDSFALINIHFSENYSEGIALSSVISACLAKSILTIEKPETYLKIQNALKVSVKKAQTFYAIGVYSIFQLLSITLITCGIAFCGPLYLIDPELRKSLLSPPKEPQTLGPWTMALAIKQLFGACVVSIIFFILNAFAPSVG